MHTRPHTHTFTHMCYSLLSSLHTGSRYAHTCKGLHAGTGRGLLAPHVRGAHTLLLVATPNSRTPQLTGPRTLDWTHRVL